MILFMEEDTQVYPAIPTSLKVLTKYFSDTQIVADAESHINIFSDFFYQIKT